MRSNNFNTKTVSMSLDDISLDGVKADRNAVNTAWDKFGAVVNATRANGTKAVKLDFKPYLSRPVFNFQYQ